ncbi:MAG: ankyrin repeat domain-containing protein, partial [Candidatus Helarchaeota archaeon]
MKETTENFLTVLNLTNEELKTESKKEKPKDKKAPEKKGPEVSGGEKLKEQLKKVFAMIEKNKINEIKTMLNENPNLVNEKDKYDHTPLHIAAFYGKSEIAKLLIENGADVYKKNNFGETPLDIAKKLNNNKEIIELLEKYQKKETETRTPGEDALDEIEEIEKKAE